MPWDPSQASGFTRKADTPKSERAFADAANNVLERTGNEGRAVRAGNAAAAMASKRPMRKSKRK